MSKLTPSVQVLPGVLAVLVPTVVGVSFRILGEYTDRPMLGAEVLGSFLMFATVTGILMVRTIGLFHI
jgi:Na+/H+-translocating membrane pyrophosphatase